MNGAVAGVVSLLAGYAVMGLELTAVRLLAPHFGDSAPVWTNVIGVMLVALAAGAWLGGRIAEPGRGTARLSTLLLVSGTLTALLPLWSGTLGGWLLPQELPLDSAMVPLVRGSLAATLVLFAPPVALIGCMTPVLVAALAHRDGRVGRASGLVAAMSTLGSLVGTFATTHLVVPGLGSRASVWLCAALILLCAALLRPGWARGAVVLLPLALLPWPWGPLRPPLPGQELLAEVESRYQYLQVVREAAAPPESPNARVLLKINEGLDSFHSVTVEGAAFTGGLYYDYHLMAPFLAADGAAPTAAGELRVVSLGAAAGTFARVFGAAFPGCTVDGVEIDPAVAALGEADFGGRGQAVGTGYALDARVFAERAAARYDVVLVDAYERQIYLPAHVASREFFTAVKRLLRPGGVVSVNSGGRNFDDPVVEALAHTMAAVFGDAHAFRVPQSRNFVLLARREAPLDPAAVRRAAAAAGTPAAVAAVLRECNFAGAWRRFGPGEPVLEDDRPFLDTLQERALARQFGGNAPVAMAGAEAPVEVASRATAQLLEERDYEGALATLRSARSATARLRLLAGDARWYMHDLPGALAEYEAALQLDDLGELRAFAERKAAAARHELAGPARAAVAAARSFWVALGAMVAAAGALCWASRTTRAPGRAAPVSG